jgi:hypothetical protein
MTITANQALSILAGTELSGKINLQYKVSYAVPNSIMYTSRNGNSSGLSFGVVQLDIGANAYAQSAYVSILNLALNSGKIDNQTYDQLKAFNGVKRPDLNAELASYLPEARTALNAIILTTPGAKQIIDDVQNQYVTKTLLPKLNSKIDSLNAYFETDNVLNSGTSDTNLALSALVSLYNRNPTLFNDAISNIKLKYGDGESLTLQMIKDEYNYQLGNLADWPLVQKGATSLENNVSVGSSGNTLDSVIPNSTPIVAAGGFLKEMTLNPQYYKHCFPASALITLADNTQTTIDKIDVGTLVATYDPTANKGRGALVSGVVTNTFTNITQEFIKISSACGRINSSMTPGHEILCPDGEYRQVQEIYNNYKLAA